MKSRGVYETPGGTLLYAAHSELEQLVLDRQTLAAKDLIAPRYADLVYEGRWWTTEREAYDAFVNVTQERITGTVTLRLYKGWRAGRRPRERARAVRRALRHLRRGRRLPAERRGGLHPPLRPARSACARSRTRSCATTQSATTHDPQAGTGRRSRATRSSRRASRSWRAYDRRPTAPAGGTHKLWGGRFGGGPSPLLRRAQQLHRHRLPPLAARHPALEGVGRRALERRRPHARRRAGRWSAGSIAVAARFAAGEQPERDATRTCTR